MGCVASNILCNPTINKCIGNDTKAAARQSLNCIKNQKNMAKNDFQYAGWNSYTLQCGTITTLISSGDCTLQCGMWLWNVTVNSPSGSTLRGSGMTCQWMCPNVRHIGILHMVSISTHHRSRHVILYQSAKFYPNLATLDRKKMRHVDFQDGVSQPSWIV